MRAWLSRIFANIRALSLALIVHIVLFTLMGVSLSWNKTVKPSAQSPIQAVAIIEPEIKEKLPKLEPIPKPQPIPEPIVEPPKPKPEPKPVPKSYSYPCEGKILTVDDEAKAKALQAECEAMAQRKKEAIEQAEKDKLLVKKKLETERKEADRKKKEKARKEAERKEADRKKKEKARKEAERKEADSKKKEKARKEAERKQAIAKQKAANDKRLAEEAALAAQLQGRRIKGEAETALGLAVGRIAAAVNSNWIQPQSATFGLKALIEVNVARSGEVMSARVVNSSGNAFFDRSAELAVRKASPLPIPTDPRYYPHIKIFRFNFDPNG